MPARFIDFTRQDSFFTTEALNQFIDECMTEVEIAYFDHVTGNRVIYVSEGDYRLEIGLVGSASMVYLLRFVDGQWQHLWTVDYAEN